MVKLHSGNIFGYDHRAMYYLIYVSYASGKMKDTDLRYLLRQCSQHNLKNQITGMLVCIDGKFIEVLEGERGAVVDQFDNITIDPRHRNVSVVLEGNTRVRNFNDWSMAFHSNSKITTRESAYRDPETLFGSTSMINQNHPVFTFLKLFYEKNRSKEEAAQAS